MGASTTTRRAVVMVPLRSMSSSVDAPEYYGFARGSAFARPAVAVDVGGGPPSSVPGNGNRGRVLMVGVLAGAATRLAVWSHTRPGRVEMPCDVPREDFSRAASTAREAESQNRVAPSQIANLSGAEYDVQSTRRVFNGNKSVIGECYILKMYICSNRGSEKKQEDVKRIPESTVRTVYLP